MFMGSRLQPNVSVEVVPREIISEHGARFSCPAGPTVDYPRSIPTQDEPKPAQLEHSTPCRVESAAAVADADEEWVALLQQCQAAVDAMPYPEYLPVPTVEEKRRGLRPLHTKAWCANQYLTADGRARMASSVAYQRASVAHLPPEVAALYLPHLFPQPSQLDKGNLPLSQTSLAQQEIGGRVLRAVVRIGSADPRAAHCSPGQQPLVHNPGRPVRTRTPPTPAFSLDH